MLLQRSYKTSSSKKMNNEIVAIYCLCDDILKAMNHQGDVQQQMSDAEVMTTAIVAVLYFGGNFEQARKQLSEPQYIPKMLSRSRFNRRLHRVEPMFLTLQLSAYVYHPKIADCQ